jgi:hypothetical protein
MSHRCGQGQIDLHVWADQRTDEKLRAISLVQAGVDPRRRGRQRPETNRKEDV